MDRHVMLLLMMIVMMMMIMMIAMMMLMNTSCHLIIQYNTFSIHLIALQLEEQRIHLLTDLTM
jgi:hypothetical protein